MKRFRFRWLCVALVSALSNGTASAATGPYMQPLRVSVLYTVNTSQVYVEFQPGSMPGCYGNSGGFLLTTNPRFKEIYAELLMMIALGGVRAVVVYTQNVPTGNWSDCYFDGLHLVP